MRNRILIADDQPAVLKALRVLLEPAGYGITEATSPSAVLELLRTHVFDLLLMDLNYTRDTTSGREGLDLLPRIQEVDASLAVVVMTAFSSIDVAVEAMQRGARDFVEKPWENDRLLSIVQTQVRLVHALREGRRLEAENRLLRGEDHPELIAESRAMRPVLELVARVGPSDANVLITGENGTGKSLVARVLHARSLRASKPMVTVNIGGIAAGLFESEFFGHVKGAFTDAKTDRIGRFEMADRGTLFLDEIASIPAGMQPKLLRVLETGEYEAVGSSRTVRVDVRVVSATNADVYREVESGGFREDLFYRLNTVEIPLPPLRNRTEDIPLLASRFLATHSRRYRKKLGGIASAAMQTLLDHTWPGNVRELDHAVERAVLMARDDTIRPDDLALRPTRSTDHPFDGMTLEQLEAVFIAKALDRHDGSVKKAAVDLGLSRSGLYRRMEKHALNRRE